MGNLTSEALVEIDAQRPFLFAKEKVKLAFERIADCQLMWIPVVDEKHRFLGTISKQELSNAANNLSMDALVGDLYRYVDYSPFLTHTT